MNNRTSTSHFIDGELYSYHSVWIQKSHILEAEHILNLNLILKILYDVASIYLHNIRTNHIPICLPYSSVQHFNLNPLEKKNRGKVTHWLFYRVQRRTKGKTKVKCKQQKSKYNVIRFCEVSYDNTVKCWVLQDESGLAAERHFTLEKCLE